MWPLALIFKQLISGSDKQILPNSAKVFSICLYRCLSIFLINYLLVNYWNLGENVDSRYFSKLICNLFELKNEEETQLFVDSILGRILRLIGFNIEVQMGLWEKNGISPGERHPNANLEAALAAIIFPLMKKPANFVDWIIKKMYTNFDDISSVYLTSAKRKNSKKIKVPME